MMGYELTREARASQVLPRLGRPEQAVALVLADICMDTSRRPPRNMNAGARVCEDLGISMGTLGNILAKMAARGIEVRVPIGKNKNGGPVYAAKGHALDFLFPPLAPRPLKGPRNDGPSAPEDDSEGPRNDGPSESKGPSNNGASDAKGPRFEAQRSTESWTPTPVTPNSKDDARRVGDPIADKLSRDQGQDQSQDHSRASLAASHKLAEPASSRLLEDQRPDDAQRSPSHAQTAPLTVSGAREGEPEPTPDDSAEFPQVAPTYGKPVIGDAGAPLPEPAQPAASGVTKARAVGYRWRSPQEKAAEQAAESRAQRALADQELEVTTP